MEKNNKTKLIKHYLLSFLLIISFISCSTYKYKIDPQKKDTHRMIRLKVHYYDGKNKHNGKVIVLKQNKKKKVFILNPLGRVHFKLILNREKTTAIYVKKNIYWDGIFLEFIDRFWGLNLSFEEFYEIIISGKIPDKIKNNDSIKINIIKRENIKPRLIEIRRKKIYLKFKVLKNREKSGRIDFKIDKTKLKRVTFNKLFD